MAIEIDMKNQAIRREIKIYFDEDVVFTTNVVELEKIKPRKLKKMILTIADAAFERRFFSRYEKGDEE